ncbi:hypothetical protein COLO4_15062 [Corchorus olitorius]|uniref:Uncharacterized protein n=1 Tax=Corchorus olitorius TaxID=93759 RepID=A0A1R3JPS3_9ROSI|nr:hypothetical protein COLO4_15062 [Corchorus olitorius]
MVVMLMMTFGIRIGGSGIRIGSSKTGGCNKRVVGIVSSEVAGSTILICSFRITGGRVTANATVNRYRKCRSSSSNISRDGAVLNAATT